MAKKVSTRRAWTTEHVRTLKTLARKKTRAASIAKTLKRTEGATRQKAFSLGLSLDFARVTSRRSVSATLPTSPATHVRGAFLCPISAYIRCTPLPRCTIDQRRKGGVFLRHCRRTGEICYDFR